MKARAAAVALVLVIGAACSGGHAHKLAAAGRSTTTTELLAGAESSSTTSSVTVVSSATTTTGGTIPPKPRPTPTTASASPTTAPPNLSNDNVGIVVVTEADDGKTFTLHRANQGITVQLSNDNVWAEPQASNAAVLTRTSGSTQSDGSAQATFMAAGDGQATVSADGRSHPVPCETAQPPCMVPDHIVHFQVTVTVVG